MTSEPKGIQFDVKENTSGLLRDGIHYTGNKGPTIGIRHVQVTVVAVTIGIAYSLRSSFSVAIIAMTENNTSSNSDVPTYEWNNKSVILSALFWGLICLPLISGYLGKIYGPKWFMFGMGLIDSLAFILIPLAARYSGSTGVIICRLVEGLVQGMIDPINACVMGKWVPTEERSKMGFVVAAAVTLSIFSTSMASGYISESDLGWPWVFYIFGGLGLAWSAFFAFMAEQSPAKYSRIPPEEKKYIETSLSQGSEKELPTPWRNIFTSIHVWAIIVAQIGTAWIMIILQTEISIFMTKVMKFGVKSNGLIFSIAPLCGTVSGLVASILSDWIPKRKILSLLNSRRLFHTIGLVGVSISFLMMTVVPVKNAKWAVVFLCLANVFLICTVIGGSDINVLDLSPRFAGLILGCYSTISQALSLVAPLLVQLIVPDESDSSQWRTIFIITAVIGTGTAIFFDIFASATRQSWDGETEKEAKFTAAKRKGSVFSITGVIVP